MWEYVAFGFSFHIGLFFLEASAAYSRNSGSLYDGEPHCHFRAPTRTKLRFRVNPKKIMEIVTVKPVSESTDLLFILKTNDFDIRSESVGFSSFNVQARVFLDVIIADSKGAQIWKKTIVSPWKSKIYNGFSQKKYETTYGTIVLEAIAVAMKNAVRGMFMGI